jgi:hypothetical protein
MTLLLQPYIEQLAHWPRAGRHILAQFDVYSPPSEALHGHRHDAGLLELRHHGGHGCRRQPSRSTAPVHVSSASLCRPQVGKSDRQRFEGLALHDGFGTPSTNDAISSAVESEHLQRLKQGVDQPDVTDELASIDRQLLGSVDRRGRWREDFADPVRRYLERARLRQRGHTLATPACDIRNKDVAAEVKLWLDQDDPTTRSSSTTVERAIELASEAGGGASVRRRRAGTGVKLTVENLSHKMSGHGSEIIVRGAAPWWIGHGPDSLAGCAAS